MTTLISTNVTERSRFRRVISVLHPHDRIVIGWTLGIKVLLFLFGAAAYQILENKRLPGIHGLLQLWNRWDALAYQNLAQFGYQATSEFKTWFYPLFPWVVRMFAHVTGDNMTSAFLVSGIASLVAAILLRRIVELDFSSAIALRSVWFFLIFPTAYFLHVGYTESLFLSLALGSIFAARTQRWWLAGLLGGLSCMTRATGLVLIPAFAIEIAHQFVLEKRIRWSWLWIGLIPLGFGVYLTVNWYVAGDPFAFLRLRRELFYASTTWPWDGFRDAFGHLEQQPSRAQLTGVQELVFMILGLVCISISCFKLRPLYTAWITGVWAISAGTTFISGMPRYSLTMFPIFIIFAIAAANRFWNGMITVWSLIFLGLFASLFVRGWWAF